MCSRKQVIHAKSYFKWNLNIQYRKDPYRFIFEMITLYADKALIGLVSAPESGIQKHLCSCYRKLQIRTIPQDIGGFNGHPMSRRFSGVAKLRVNCILFVRSRTSLNLPDVL